MKLLVVGVSGMLGNAMFRKLSERADIEVFGTARSESAKRFFPTDLANKIITGADVENQDCLSRIFSNVRPNIVINCIGLIKHLSDADDLLQALPLNAMLPHRLARLCDLAGARLVHISTDCVFSGAKGGYIESDFADATDLYGRSKLLGEVSYPHTITLRTSIIGHELSSNHGLLCWFLAQNSQIRGYTNAIFSGIPTVELANIVSDFILPRPDLCGLYHVAAAPISKYDLLKLIANVYDKKLEIIQDSEVVIDRSLNADRFINATGYIAPPWSELVKRMFEFK
jgi:dTDP-4-dehydrorhamnose reductase